MLPVAFSIAVHGGIYSGGSTLVAQQQEQKARITQNVLHEEPPALAKKKPDLEALKKERENYVQELFSALKEGKEVRLSEFFIKSEALDERIRLAELGEFWAGEEGLRKKYAEIVEGAKRFAAGSENEVRAVFEFLRAERVMKTYYFARGMFSDVVETGWYNCSSSTMLFSAVLEDALGRRDQGVLVFDDHIKTHIGGKMIENTKEDWNEKEYDGCGLVAPIDVFVAAYLNANGVGPEEFPERISKLYTEKREWEGCPTIGKKVPDSRSVLSMPSPGVSSGMSVPPYPIPNRRHRASAEEIVQDSRGVYAAWQVAHMWDDNRFVEVELNGAKVEMNPVIIPAGVNWPEVLEMKLWDFVFEPFLSKATRGSKHCSPHNLVPPGTIPEIIEGRITRGERKFEDYTRKEICGRFGEFLDKGKGEDLVKYLGYNFCPELDGKLKEAYLREKNMQIIWYGIGNLQNPDDFDFLLGELKKVESDPVNNAGIALVLSDKERACKLFSTLRCEERRMRRFELIWACGDSEAAWEEIMDFYSGKNNNMLLAAALSDLDPSTTNQERRKLLLGLAGKVGLQQRLQIAGILYEAGDKENGMGMAREFVKEAEKGDGGFTCDFPKEVLPGMVPLMGDPRYADGIAYEVVWRGERNRYLPMLKETLRRVLNDRNEEGLKRERAALALLMLGVDPFGKD
jgi:hypothetical protein